MRIKQFGAFRLDASNQCLLREGARIDLAPKPFAVLRYLVDHPDRLITHDELLDALWPETYVQPQVLRTYVLELRKVLGDHAAQPRFIQTLPKRGYRFVAAVTELADAPAAGLHAAWQKAGATAIVGRDEELAILDRELRLLKNGERRVVFVTGEAGIGKTALVDAFCRRIDPALGASVARGQCVQAIGMAEEYYPVTEALSELCASPLGEKSRAIFARRSPAWLAPRRSPETEDSQDALPAAQQRTLADLCAALEELAAERPLILIFEDLHWADDSTLNLVSALARRRAPARLMMVATYCPQSGTMPDAAQAPPQRMKQDLLRRRLCTEVPLAPLSKTAVRALLRRDLGQESLPQGLVDFVCQRSEGNPLFAIAAVEHLMAQGTLARRGAVGTAQWELCEPFPETGGAVPDALARMIEMEIERLSKDEQRLLEAASLMSFAFPAWAVAAALENDPIETEEACDALARRLHFVVRAGEDELPDGTRSAFYVFAHGLYREVLYQRQSVARRARRHVRIAERLAALFAGRETDVAREVAMHYEAAGEHKLARRAVQSAEMQARQAGVC